MPQAIRRPESRTPTQKSSSQNPNPYKTMKTIQLIIAALALAALPSAALAGKACDKCCKDRGKDCKTCCADAGKKCGKDCCKE